MQFDDNARVALAQAIKHIQENWAMHMELIALQAKMAKARYDALRKAGFDAGDSLRLCTKPMEL